MLSDYCIYTIRHSSDLLDAAAGGGSGKYQERKRWAQGERLLVEARQQQERLPIVFAAAEATNPLFGWALLDEVILDGAGTTYSFSDFRLFEKPRPSKSSLKKKANREPLDGRFIRPYAICRTPQYLQRAYAASSE